MQITKRINIGENNAILKVTENGPTEKRAEMNHHKVSEIQ